MLAVDGPVMFGEAEVSAAKADASIIRKPAWIGAFLDRRPTLAGSVEAVLIIALAYLTVQLIWVWTDDSRFMAAASPPAQVDANVTQIIPDYDVLRRFDPFFRSAAPSSAATGPAVQAPESALDLHLVGVHSRDAGGPSTAIIRTPDKRQALFLEGQEVIDGTRLVSIRSDYVTISRAGTLESLSLTNRDNDAVADDEPDVVAEAKPGRGAGELTIDDPNLLLTGIDLQPRREGRAINGFVLQPKGNGRLFSRLGLEPGDVLLAFNDTRLVSMERVTDAVDELGPESEINLLIERGGSERVVALHLKEDD